MTIVDSISNTSMPINEFVVYREFHQYNIKQILIVCENDSNEMVDIPDTVDVHYVGSCARDMRNIIQKIEQNSQMKIIYHLHHQKSALLFYLATVFLGLRKRCVYTVHSSFASRDFKYKISSIICVLLSNYVNCVSSAAYNDYPNLIRKIKKDCFTTIENGVDIYRIEKSLEKSEKIYDKNTIICVGRLIPIKNQSFLLKLMTRLPDMKLILVGKEDKRYDIRKMAIDYGVADRVSFTGLIPRDEVFRKLTMASLYLSSSLVEGLPVSVLEAMYAGLIPIVSDISPHKEIKDKCEYIDVLPLNEEKWLSRIKHYRKLDDLQIKSIKNNIKNSILNNFSLDIMHKKYIEVYLKCLGG